MGVHSVNQARFCITKLSIAKYRTRMMTVMADMSKPLKRYKSLSADMKVNLIGHCQGYRGFPVPHYNLINVERIAEVLY